MKEKVLIIFVLVFLVSHAVCDAQNPLANKVTSQKISNYVFIQKEQIEEWIHQNVLNGTIKAYPDLQLTKPYRKEELTTLGGVFESIQYSPNPNDPYAYRDTLLLTPFNTERITAWKFSRTNESNPYSPTNIQSLAFYYKNTDTTSAVLYHVPFAGIISTLKRPNQLLMEYLLSQMPFDGVMKSEGWNAMANALFKSLTSEMLAKAQQRKVECFTDKELTYEIINSDWQGIVNFNYVRKGENGQNAPKLFDASDIDYISTYELSEQQDSITIITNKSIGIGHFIVITGVDQIERQLFWTSYSNLPNIVGNKRDVLLAHILYYHRLQLLDGNKSYMSNYFINKAKE